MARVSRRNKIAAAQTGQLPSPMAAQMKKSLRIYRVAVYVRLSIMDTRDRKDSESLQTQIDYLCEYKSLGNKLWLVEVSPAYEYQNNRRTDTILGYRYTVALPDKGLDKINVRIDGDKLMDAPDGYVEVRFDGLEVFIYWSQGQPQVGAKATGIHLANPKT